VQDASGRWFIDARSSLRTVTLGYGHPEIVDAIIEQTRRLPFAEIIRHDRPSAVAVAYADALSQALGHGFTRVRFTSSGARMVEEAVILSRFVRVSAQGRPTKTAVITHHGAWHGSGSLALALAGDPRVHSLCGPLTGDVHHVPPEDFAALRELIATLGVDRVSAVLLEPVLTTSGTFLSPAYMREVARFCRARDIHVIMDEVTTGAGRLGSLAHSISLGITPDFLVLGKGLTSGYVPIAALATTEEVYRAALTALPVAVPHSSTSDGHPLAMAAGLAVLRALDDGSIYDHVRATGSTLGAHLTYVGDKNNATVRHVGQGYLHYAFLEADGGPWGLPSMARLVEECEDRGLLVDRQGSAIILSPPLIATQTECAEMVAILAAAISAAESSVSERPTRPAEAVAGSR
jgi:adenosylmethionine-8-amino-7-oxononanoate aminotransferase